ncbi:MAG: UDP-2,3-diacylglucosamine hydrolase, partial [Pseudomonadota bacterium]
MGAAPRILLISDLHLEEARPALTDAFLHFLATEAQASSALYILGDLFNVWLGDDDDRPLRSTVVAALRGASQRGLLIRLLHGNRDFLLGEHFASDCGAELLESPCLLEHGERRFVLTHGDELCTRDTDYQAFRQQVRDPVWQGSFLARPLEERRAFAEQA